MATPAALPVECTVRTIARSIGMDLFLGFARCGPCDQDELDDAGLPRREKTEAELEPGVVGFQYWGNSRATSVRGRP